jgi:CheY-like chemotaxis protein
MSVLEGRNNATRILLVEDEAIIAMAERSQLVARGYEVLVAISASEAVRLVDDAPWSIDLILMDIDLGWGIDGIEVARRILAKHDLPIAFLSSHREPSVIEETETISSYGYILKNSGLMVLDASIKMALKLFESHKRLGLAEGS